MARLKEIYKKTIAPAMKEEFNYGNPMQIPSISKIVVNMGCGEASQNSKLIEGALTDMIAITGQKPVVTRLGNRLLTSSCVMVCRWVVV